MKLREAKLTVISSYEHDIHIFIESILLVIHKFSPMAMVDIHICPEEETKEDDTNGNEKET